MTAGTDVPRPDRAAGSRSPSAVPSPVAHGLSAALALVTVTAAVPTVFVDGVLRGPAAMNGSARGTALIMLGLAVPALVTGQVATRRGVGWATAVWLGSCGYLIYNAFMLLFATPFNGLFLLYVAAFGLAGWTTGAILRVIDPTVLVDRRTPGPVCRMIAVFAWLVAALNAVAWLRSIVPALGADGVPAFLVGTGLPTAPTYVQDLAVWLPLMAVSAYWLWRGLAWGHLIVASVLFMWVVESVTIAADQYLGAAADPASTVVSASMVPVFAIVAAIMGVAAWLMLRRW